MRIIYLTLFCIGWFLSPAAAQSCAAIEYTSKDGLPAGGFTSSFQDRDGYLWVNTYANGCTRFDGKKWTRFSITDGLLANKMDVSWQDKSGRMWFDHGQYGMTMLSNDGKFHQFKPFKDRPNDIERYTVSPGGQVFFYHQQTREISRFDPQTGQKVPIGVMLPNDTLKYSSNLFLTNDHDLNGAIYMPNNNKGQPVKVFKFSENKWELQSSLSATPSLPLTPGVLNYPIIGNVKEVKFFKNKGWEIVPPPSIRLLNGAEAHVVKDIQCLNFDYFNRKVFVIWKLAETTGIKQRYLLAEYDASMNLVGTCVFATYHLPVHAIKDRNGTFWVSCGTALLRVFPQFQNVTIDARNMLPQVWAVAQAPDSQMWFASYGKGLVRFDGLDLHPQPEFLKQFNHYDDGSLVDKKTGEMFFNIEGAPGKGGLLRFDGKKKWARFSDGIMSTYLDYDKKGQLMRGTFYKGLWLLPEGADISVNDAWEKIDTSKGLEFTQTIHTALEDRYGRYWMGHLHTGLACYDPKSRKIWNWTKSRSTDNYGVISMSEDAQGNLWLGTDQGLRFLKLPEDMDDQFDFLSHLSPVAVEYMGESTVSVCRLYDEKTLILGNAKGFFLLDLPAFYKGNTLISAFVPATGHLLGSINQNGIWVDKQKRIWLACTGGVTCFDPSYWVRNTLSPLVIHLDSIRIGHSIFKDLSKEIEVSLEAANGKIWCRSDLSPKLLDNVTYLYRFSNDTATWFTLRENGMFELPNLVPGHYKFEIIADCDGVRSKSEIVEFQISGPLWKSPRFWLLILLGISGVSALWWRRELKISAQKLLISNQQLQLEKSINEMAQINKEKDKLQVQAIVNQLNPHFINNALQWLQVRVDEDNEAVRVVGKLSENISTVFKNSRLKKAFHSLRDEMKLAENYLFIQKCRFGDKLSYEMPNEEALSNSENLNVPLMIVQIHAENAVEHGIRNKKTGVGWVHISLSEEDLYTVIKIEDDGVGRAAAQKIGSKGTQNGTTMLKELETIYNRQNQHPLEQFYEDDIFVDMEGKGYGTRVIIRMPKDYNFEF